ncbi:iripin-2-like [Brevipalpus obovatus]|uniref:iripin-2-like n=1 Tax=Brevipalpus obovatus TaxID=246614 RepID=UPI003D9ECFEB
MYPWENRLKTSFDRFTADFLRKVSENDDKNILVSPVGIIVLYIIILEGAHGKTADQIMQVFRLKPEFKNVEEIRVELKKIIRLPYRQWASMYIIMPLEINGIQALIHNLDAEKIEKYIQSIRGQILSTLMIPKFRSEDSHELSEILPSMGLDLPFSVNAELSGIADSQVIVSKSMQKTIIIVDEKGTEAAAVTDEDCDRCRRSEKPKVYDFILDRPFIFFIRDVETSVNLFVGVVKKLPNEE